MKGRAIPCPHQPPTRGDNTVSVAQGGTTTPGDTKQILPLDRVSNELYIYIYIYIYIYVCVCVCVCVLFGPVKPESGIIPSEKNSFKYEHLNFPGKELTVTDITEQ